MKAHLHVFLCIVLLVCSFVPAVHAVVEEGSELKKLVLFLPEKGGWSGEVKLYSISNASGSLDFSEVASMGVNSVLHVEEVSLEFMGLDFSKIDIERDPNWHREPSQILFDAAKGVITYSSQVDPETMATGKLAELKGWPVNRKLQIEDSEDFYQVFELSFEEGVSVSSSSYIDGAQAQITYALDISELQSRSLQSERLAALRESLRLNSGTDQPIDIARLKKESPGLAASIRDFIDPIGKDLYGQAGEEGRKTIDDAMRALEEQLYRISAGVDALLNRDWRDSASMNWGLLDRESRENARQEHATERIQQLVDLFYLIVKEMDSVRAGESAEDIENLAGEALRVAAEIYLVAGKTKGSVGRRSAYNIPISFASFVSLVLILPYVDSAMVQVALGVGAAASVANMVRTMFTQGSRYNEKQWLFPGVKWFEKIRSAKLLRSQRAQQFISGVNYNVDYKPELNDWEEYAKSRPQATSAEQLFKTIQLASGQDTSYILASSPCGAQLAYQQD